MQSFKITQKHSAPLARTGESLLTTWRCKKGEVLSPEERTITLESLHYWDGCNLTLYAAVIMPDHVHALVQPLTLPQSTGVFDLAEIIHSVKSFSNVGCVLRTIKGHVDAPYSMTATWQKDR